MRKYDTRWFSLSKRLGQKFIQKTNDVQKKLLGLKSLGSSLVDGGFGHLSSLVCFVELVLNLSESRHGRRSGLSGVFSRLLVRLRLGVELVNAVTESLEVLLVFIVGVESFFVLALELSDDLNFFNRK